MMSFKDFVAEVYSPQPGDTSLEELLRGPCVNYFKQSQKNGLLVRGVSSYGKRMGALEVDGKEFSSEDGYSFSYFKRTVRKERRPMDTAPAVSRLIDDWFEENMGIRARSEALFCYGEKGRREVSQYGDPVVVLPIGKFSYTWSPRVDDLYNIVKDTFQTGLHDKKLRARFVGEDGKPDLEAIDQAMKELGYTMNKFSEACGDDKEIMIDCEEFYLIPYYNENMLADIKKAYLKA